MENQTLVTPLLAYYAKIAGFQIPTRNIYDRRGIIIEAWGDLHLSDKWESYYLKLVDIIPAPAQASVKKWLRDEHQVDVSPRYCPNRKHWYVVTTLICDLDRELEDKKSFYPSYEFALEWGLRLAIAVFLDLPIPDLDHEMVKTFDYYFEGHIRRAILFR